MSLVEKLKTESGFIKPKPELATQPGVSWCGSLGIVLRPCALHWTAKFSEPGCYFLYQPDGCISYRLFLVK